MEIYVVGGAVRNVLMGVPVNDMDYVVVGATHKDMIDLGYTQVGADFPVYLHPTTGEEYALARTERKRGVGYHGFEVDASPEVTLFDDLRRRDLTINAMAVELERWPAFVNHGVDLIDPYNGRKDLYEQVIRPVDLSTFVEDPLRVVRAARFAAVYRMHWSKEMVQAARLIATGGELRELPGERMCIEIEKALKGCKTAGGVAIFGSFLHQLGVMDFGHEHFARSTSEETSYGSKLLMLFDHIQENDLLDDYAEMLRLPNAMLQHVRLASEVDMLGQYIQNGIVGDSEAATTALNLAQRVMRYGTDNSLEFLGQLAQDREPVRIALHAIKLGIDVIERVRYESHTNPALSPPQRGQQLKDVRAATLMVDMMS